MSFSNALQLYFLCLCVFFLDFTQLLLIFFAKTGISACEKTHVKCPHMQCSCVTCSLPVETGKNIGFCLASTSTQRTREARKKIRKLRVISPAGCRLTYLQFAGDFTRGVIADCLQFQATLCAIAGIFACDCASIFLAFAVFLPAFGGFFTCDSIVFPCSLHVFLPAMAGSFVCQSRSKLHEFCM